MFLAEALATRQGLQPEQTMPVASSDPGGQTVEVPTLTYIAPDDIPPHKANPLITVPLDRVCVVGNL